MPDELEDDAGDLTAALASQPESAVLPPDVLPDNARLVRWAGPAFVLFSVVLIPWSAYLGYTLPAREDSPHYNIAWVGFDVLLLVALGATGVFACRRSAFLAVAAAAAGTLLVVDAWFDVMTSPAGSQLIEAIVMAVVAELPLAGVCGWLSYHSEHLEEERIVLLLGGGFRRPLPRTSP
jgi:hypothetical protein